MEKIRRSIRLFFVTYSSLLFQVIGTFILILILLRVADNMYTEYTSDEEISVQEKIEEQKTKEIEKEEKILIKNFLDYCNEQNIEEAYSMLSKDCTEEKYQTIDIFKENYIKKIFNKQKEYNLEKENGLYKITILEDILESGSINNRKSIINYYEIKEEVIGKKIYIEER